MVPFPCPFLLRIGSRGQMGRRGRRRSLPTVWILEAPRPSCSISVPLSPCCCYTDIVTLDFKKGRMRMEKKRRTRMKMPMRDWRRYTDPRSMNALCPLPLPLSHFSPFSPPHGYYDAQSPAAVRPLGGRETLVWVLPIGKRLLVDLAS